MPTGLIGTRLPGSGRRCFKNRWTNVAQIPDAEHRKAVLLKCAQSSEKIEHSYPLRRVYRLCWNGASSWTSYHFYYLSSSCQAPGSGDLWRVELRGGRVRVCRRDRKSRADDSHCPTSGGTPTRCRRDGSRFPGA